MAAWVPPKPCLNPNLHFVAHIKRRLQQWSAHDTLSSAPVKRSFERQMSAGLVVCVAASLLVICLLSCKQDTATPVMQAEATSPIALQRLSAEETGIDFNNILNDEGNLNVFVWNFLYTGAGVAVGDINNDGLPDIFFGGNTVPDRLYLNKGNFRFEDISEQAGIIADTRWTTGVTMADVNGDGLLDIYVCHNSPTPNRNANRNKLYINLGNNRFEEQAARYGLADEGLSIQATFFDFDQDGDLDMFLINQPFDELAEHIHDPSVVSAYPVTDRFFENTGAGFVDRTNEMGFESARYGLAMSLGDFDGNGWTDIYVCNDYIHGDFLYMNTGGRFREELRERTGHTSFYSMGADAGDVNNDGWEDIFILDMAFDDHYRAKTNMESMRPDLFWDLVAQGHHYQYAQNTLQRNRGDGYFTETAQVGGLSKSDWSWATVFADLDHDGMQDIVVTNGILRDMKNNDFALWLQQAYEGRVGPANYREALTKLPSNPIPNKLYRNIDGLLFADVTEAAGFAEPGFSHGLAYADLDGDGALDLVLNNMNSPAGIYRNVSAGRGNFFTLTLTGPGRNTHGLGIPLMFCADGKCTARTMQTSRGYFSSSPPELHFGMGSTDVVDSVVIWWNANEMSVLTGLRANRKHHVQYADAKKQPRIARPSSNIGLAESTVLPFVHLEVPFNDYRDQVLLPYKLSQNGPFIAQGDIDGDGLDDLFIGGAAGQPGTVLKQLRDGSFVATVQPAFVADAAHEDQGAVFFDIDGDGDLDLYVASGSNEVSEGDALLIDRVYLNDGRGTFARSMAALPDGLRINGQCVTVIDVNGDGGPDLFVGGRLVAGQYPLPARSAILINEQGVLKDRTQEIAPFLEKFGLVTAAVVIDVDNDDDPDLMIAGEWMAPTILLNEGGKFSSITLDTPGVGLWFALAVADIDGDGKMDVVAGNLGWNQKFGGKSPKLTVYAGDFDDNGDHDVVLAKSVSGREIPYRGRECSSEEMPFVAVRFPTYDAFASALLTEILGEDNLKASMHAQINTLSSVWLRNEGGMRFTAIPLPDAAQTGPVKALWIDDIDGDGALDMIYAGNHFPVEVETARFDGLLHGICFGDGRGGFQARVFSASHQPLMGDYRDMRLLEGRRLVLAQNDGPVILYRIP